MAFREYIWPSANSSTQVIAQSQTVTVVGLGNFPVILNGVYSLGPAYNQNIPGQYTEVTGSSNYLGTMTNQFQDAPSQYVVPFPGFFRKIRITSGSNLSALTFHVTGTYAGQLLTEDITGPNGAPADSVNFYDTILSVTVSGAPAPYGDINIGLGLTGGLAYFNYDFKQPLSTMAVEVLVTGTINYTFGVTLQDVMTLPFSSLFFSDATGSMTNQGSSRIASTSINVFKYATILITTGEGGGTDGTGALDVFFLQSGF